MRKVQLTYKREEIVPATASDLVTMNHGRTLKEELSTNPSDRFLREVAVMNSTDRIADGAYGGAYESLTFKGRSLVNLSPFSELFDLTPSVLDRQAVIWFGNTSKTRVNLSTFKPNTKYIVKIGNDTPSRFKGIYISGLNMPNPNGYYTEHNCTFTTSSTIPTEANMYIKGVEGEVVTESEYSKCQILILEYQDGIEDWDTPYFDGLCDVKMPILRSENRKIYSTTYILGNLSGADGTEISHGNMRRTGYINIACSRGREITVSCNGRFELLIEKAMLYDKNKNYLRRAIPLDLNASPITFTVPNDAQYCRFAFCKRNYTELTDADFQSIEISIEEGNVEDSKKPYKANVLRTPEDIVLREVNEIQDTYNPLTGEYVKRIGEIAITNVVSKGVSLSGDNIRVSISMSALNADYGTTKANNTLSDKFRWSEANAKDVEGLRVNGSTFYWCINKNKLSSPDLQGVNAWLKSNPITVQYELATPITTIIKPSVIPFAYRNGHLIVESGFDGQSLLPELSYSVPASKNGVLSTTAKTLLNHEQRLYKLEDLLLRECVLMDYQLTLSFLNDM